MINLINKTPYFDDVVKMLYFGLVRSGYSVKIYSDPQLTGLNIVFGAHVKRYNKIPKNSILFNLEKLSDNSPHLNELFIEKINNFPVLDYSQNNVNYIKSKFNKKDVYFFRLGYVPELETIEKTKEIYDVYFYGCINNRRKFILDKLKNEGIKVITSPGITPAWGKERDKLISQSKIILNMHFYLTKTLEIVRILPLLANKKCVVSELEFQCEVYNGLLPSCAFSSYENIINTIKKYLNNNELRKKQEIQGYQCCIQYPIENSINSIKNILK